MSINHYGIYLAYPPTVDLRYEGLGRQLAAFIKGAEGRKDIRFVLVCPSWNKKMLNELFQSEGIRKDTIDICCPTGKNIVLTLYELYCSLRQKSQLPKEYSLLTKLLNNYTSLEKKVGRKLLTARNFFTLSGYLIVFLPFIVTRIIITIGSVLSLAIQIINKKTTQKLMNRITKRIRKAQEKFFNPKKNALIWDLYQGIAAKEIRLMHKLIDKMDHIKAWYTPTAFWPSFNQINAPKLMCVPDVVLTEFPIGFCHVGGVRFLETFNKVEETIRNGEYFVTYSEHIKVNTLINRYGIEANYIKVIPHSANKLDSLISIQGYDSEESSIRYCQQLLASALRKAVSAEYASIFKNTEVKFLFYASQFRPSKNILTLLKAYKYLLRNRFISHKLLLTGRPGVMAEIDAYIHEHSLNYDVLLLPGITMSELAACYKLADLVINPSLSEGGCPFTFTEALSVNTPVIMANISVTTEVITDKQLQEMMLFDPYNWKALVNHVEWALENREVLLSQQLHFYNKLKERTWENVVNDHIDMLEHIASVSKNEYIDKQDKNIVHINKISPQASIEEGKRNPIKPIKTDFL